MFDILKAEASRLTVRLAYGPLYPSRQTLGLTVVGRLHQSVEHVNSRTSGRQLQHLVAPVKWTTTMSVKRLFEESEYPVRVVGSSKMDAALSQLDKNDDYHAVLIDWDEAPDDGLALSCAIKERGDRLSPSGSLVPG